MIMTDFHFQYGMRIWLVIIGNITLSSDPPIRHLIEYDGWYEN